MCGRFALTKPAGDLAAELGIDEWEEIARWLPGFNLAPTRETPAILATGSRQRLGLLRWGLIPGWANDPAIGNKLANARAETVGEKPSFRHLVGRRHAAVPASGYYEWQSVEGRKQPYFIQHRDGALLLLAALWDLWSAPDGTTRQTYTLITTTPAPGVAFIHDRMPVIVPRDALAAWLHPAGAAAALAMLRPYDGELTCHPVSPQVNRVTFDGPECLRRVVPEPPPQPTLF